MAQNLEWLHLVDSMQEPGDSDMNIANNANLGASTASPEQLLQTRRVFGQVAWLTTCCLESMKSNDRQTSAAACTDARQVLIADDSLKEERRPLVVKIPVRKGTPAAFNQALNHLFVRQCDAMWGPPINCVRNLLSPATTMMMVFLGPDLAKPILDLAFAFATDYREYMIAWMGCPVDSEHMEFLEIKKRAAELRSNPAITSPGAAILHLVNQAEEPLFNIIHALYNAFYARGFNNEDRLMPAIPAVSVSEVFATPAVQYANCVEPVNLQVQTIPIVKMWIFGNKIPNGNCKAGCHRRRYPERRGDVFDRVFLN